MRTSRPSTPPVASADLDQLRAQAKELLRAARNGDEKARARLAAVSGRQTLAAAQLVLARGYGLASSSGLKLAVETRLALDSGDLRRVAELLADEPEFARVDLEHWALSPLGYVAMLRYDTSRQVWREVVGTGAVAR